MMDLEQIGALLRRIEVRHDLEGWHHDGQMTVYLVYDRQDEATADMIQQITHGGPPPVRNARYAAQAILTPLFFRRGRLLAHNARGDHDLLRRFAMNLAYGDASDGPEGIDALRWLLQLPGILGFVASYEAWSQQQKSRVVMMVDADDRVHHVHRVRDEPAELQLDSSFGGDISTSLRILMDLAKDRLPKPDEFFLRYPSLEAQLKVRGKL